MNYNYFCWREDYSMEATPKSQKTGLEMSKY